MVYIRLSSLIQELGSHRIISWHSLSLRNCTSSKNTSKEWEVSQSCKGQISERNDVGPFYAPSLSVTGKYVSQWILLSVNITSASSCQCKQADLSCLYKIKEIIFIKYRSFLSICCSRWPSDRLLDKNDDGICC